MSSDLDSAINAAKKAGEIIQSAYQNKKNIVKKGNLDFVTNIDIQVEKKIFEHLKCTEYSFKGEETGEIKKKSNKKWIIDPIDGTYNFIHTIPFFAISIALMEGDNKLLLGVVYNPITQECYWAENGEGAYMNGIPILVSQQKNIHESIFLMEHGHLDESKNKYLQCMTQLMLKKNVDVFRQGSSAIMLCLFAKGAFDAFLCCGDELHDYAAGLIIAKEAGAIISDWKGNEWNNSSNYILATNKELKKQIVEETQKI